MTYTYAAMRSSVFTEDGQVMFLKIRDNAKELLKASGAVMCDRLMAGCVGDIWKMLACIDRLVELGELVEVPNPRSSAGQHRVFIGGRST